jgi:hypothetical protein
LALHDVALDRGPAPAGLRRWAPAHSGGRLAGIAARVLSPAAIAALVVGVTLGGLLVGYEPVGDDPDLMYRPIKSELARALREGRIPYWSDRFGLGMPLVAESHVAAFYPPNLLYGVLDVPAAYRLLMWLHHVALAAATYLYARELGIGGWGGATAAVSFSLCGFMAAHACHEPFYGALPYLPLALWAGRRYAQTGSPAWQAALALILGVQLTLGHFQLQACTAGLVLVLGASEARGRRELSTRGLGLLAAVAWSWAVAAVQLAPTLELLRDSGFERSGTQLSRFALPPSQWTQLALPRLFAAHDGAFWGRLGTTPGESWLYVGTVPLILACLALVDVGRDRALRAWLLIIPVGFAVACLPLAWPGAYRWLLSLPGLGHFRAPARYTVATSLGLALLAGRGLDRLAPGPRLRAGLGLAAAFAIAAFAWALGPRIRPNLSGPALAWGLATAAVTWGVAFAAVAACRRRAAGPPILFGLAALELGLLFYASPTRWGWSEGPPHARSPMLRRLAQEPDVGLVAGFEIYNLTVPAGLAPAWPYLAIWPPPPNYLLRPFGYPEPSSDPVFARWGRRLGVTHGVYRDEGPARAGTAIAVERDPVLDRLAFSHMGPGGRAWRLERYPDAFPSARAATRAAVAPGWGELFERLCQSDERDTAWYVEDDRPTASRSPRASRARVVSWDGRVARVEHDGTCDLVIRRGYYRGWTARAGDGLEFPVCRADGGLQAVRLEGPGPSVVTFRYRSHFGSAAAAVSLVAVVAALRALAAPIGLRWAPRAGPA